jgi:small subunit ribosomal protein S27Ae
MSKEQKDQKGQKTPEKEKEKAATATPAQAKGVPAAAAAAPAAAPTEAVPEQKVKKERKQAKPKVNVQVWKLYKTNETSLERLRKECPRCGKGFFMAEHKERQSCGHCGYTTFRNKA